jgi:hypothetical protein
MGENFEGGPPTVRGSPTDQMFLMKHKGLSHTRTHLLKELRALNVTAKELATEGHSLNALKSTGYTLKEVRPLRSFCPSPRNLTPFPCMPLTALR